MEHLLLDWQSSFGTIFYCFALWLKRSRDECLAPLWRRLELWEEAYDKFNLIPLAGGNTGVQMAGWFNKEINSLEDIKGTRMRIPGLAGKVWTEAGGGSLNAWQRNLYESPNRSYRCCRMDWAI